MARHEVSQAFELKATGDRMPVVFNQPVEEKDVASTDKFGSDDIPGYTDADRKQMCRMGKKQELRRNFRIISTIGFTTCVMGTWEILLTANSQGLTAGGLAGLFWSLVWCYIGQFFVVMSLAEMASMAPTAGGQYRTLLTIAAVIGIAAFNVFAAKHLPLAQGIFATVHVFAFVPVIVCLWVLTPTKQTAAAVFTQITDNGAGWPTPGGALMVGQLSAIYLFCIDDISDALSSATGFPFIYVFQNATGTTAGTTGFVIVILVLLVMITISALASTSRQTFAFARDNGLPFSKWLGAVNSRFRIPVNSVIFITFFTIGLSLINIGSTVAFNAMLSLSTTALMATYVISIGCVTLKRVRKESLPTAQWSLGRAGLPINCIALLYAIWSFFWSFWPNSYHITATNFNWVSVLFVGLMGISGLLFVFRARHIYEGPVAKVVPMEVVESEMAA
ncbi:hypothetical protein LTR08_006107 [Meristemomyces frigidus]|nr:hypothetical protein LTR08_006107 [Meristemomyces frigidus]